MARDLHRDPAQQEEDDTQAATGGPKPIGHPTYAQVALKLLDNGYEPLPLYAGQKRPMPTGWTTRRIDRAQVELWTAQHPDAGVGLRTGRVVGIDIDVLDPEIAHRMGRIVEERTGATLMRVGLWPKRLYMVRTEQPFTKKSIRKLEILGQGQQFVTFGIHPDTGKPYYWTDDTPLDVPLSDLPLVDEATCTDLLNELATLLPPIGAGQREARRGRPGGATPGQVRNGYGIVIDGRDGWLSSIAFHTVHDAIDAYQALDPDLLAERVWERFAGTTDLSRGKKDGSEGYGIQDALRKVRDKLGLHASGRLPMRSRETPEPEDAGDLLLPDEARARLDRTIKAALETAADWLRGEGDSQPPRIGIRATVGLGKSAISRHRIAAWQRDMQAEHLPFRVLVVTPSHELAEEAALAWRQVADGPVAVLRGYEGIDPVSRGPMCRDTEMVNLAIHEGESVGRKVCYSSRDWQCPHFQGCAKQNNRKEVAQASVVLAPYDVLFTGPAAGREPFGLVLVDEGCWQRATADVRLPPLEQFATAGLRAGLSEREMEATDRMVDLAELRGRVVVAFLQDGTGKLTRAALVDAGLTFEDCEIAAKLEELCIEEANIYAGMKRWARAAAKAIVRRNEIARRCAMAWRAMAAILSGAETAPILRIASTDAQGNHRITLHGHKRMVDMLQSRPILHLDATLRRDLAAVVLPGIIVTQIEAVQPHQSLTLVPGSFGKSTLSSGDNLAAEELRRRQNRLREVVDHVRWEARRVVPGRVLVITYKAIEAAFQGIPGVETAHFNAIAGLDRYGEVDLLIVVGRPVPSSEELGPLCASLFGALPSGGYHQVLRGVRLRKGSVATVAAIAHTDPRAELVRAAICDDEVIQAIGRGRGVNRTEANPLEVQILADVALPMVHDRVVPWDSVKPDVLQRMLMAGVAVDSPADAAALHPELFETVAVADHEFRRAGFNRQNPIGDTYREMAVKSAAYRRVGRGRSWQRAWWIAGTVSDARQLLEAAIGKLAEWVPL